MKTIETVMSQLTDTDSVMTSLKEVLRETDTEYLAEEKAFEDGVQSLRQALGEEQAACVDVLIHAQDQRIASNLVFLGWLGLQLNLECFRNPVNKLFLNQDYEDIRQEAQMNSLPATRAAQQRIDAAFHQIPPDMQSLTEPITSYYCYLETTAYQLAHYFGFRLADDFLYRVVPGYAHDSKTTCSYRVELNQYLNVTLS